MTKEFQHPTFACQKTLLSQDMALKACSTGPPSGNQVDGLPLAASNATGERTGMMGIKTMYGTAGLQP